MAEPTGDAAAEPAQASQPRTALRVVQGVVLLSAFIVLARFAGGYVEVAAEWVDGLGAWGPVAYVALYAAATVFFVPGALLTLAGGAIFGVAKGTGIVFCAAVVGSGAAFLVSRHLARGWVEERIARSPRFSAIDRAIAVDGLKITFLLRLSPVLPFNALNYALGLTQVSFQHYMIGALGMLPGTLLYVYYGRVIGDVAALAGGSAPDKGAGYYAVTGLGLAATIAVTAVVTRIARRALREAEQEA